MEDPSPQQVAQLLQLALQKAQSLGGALPAAGVGGAPLDPATKHARKIYVGNLPVVVTEDMLKQFFNEALDSLLTAKAPGSAVVGCYLNLQRRFAFLEHRTIDEANFTLGLDGIQYNGHALKLRRPQDYNPTLAEAQQRMSAGRTALDVPSIPVIPSHSAAGALGIISTTVDDSPNKVFVGGLPHHMLEAEVKEVLAQFGPLKAFHLVKAPPTMPGEGERSKGFAFCEWRDASITDQACQALNGMVIGERTLNVRRAVPHAVHKATSLGVVGSPQLSVPSIALPIGINPSPIGRVSRILSVVNMVPPNTVDHGVIDEHLAELEEMCKNVGTVRSVNWISKLDAVFLEFKTTQDAVQAFNALQGRPVEDRTLLCTFTDATQEVRLSSVMRILKEADDEFSSLCREKEAGARLQLEAARDGSAEGQPTPAGDPSDDIKYL